jgi:beta-lactamase class D
MKLLFLFLIGFTDAAEPQIKNRQVCSLFLNLESKKLSAQGSHCHIASPPCSTFKIPLTATALKFNKINDTESFQWDQIKRDRDVLNKNHDLRSWLKDSVVWVSSIIVDRIGRSKLNDELKLLNYGNSQVGRNEFWLNGLLKISPHEQINYLSRNNDDYLNSALLFLPAESATDFTLYGKTGSCVASEAGTTNQVGWYVGKATSKKGTYIFVVRIMESDNLKYKSSLGLESKTIALKYFEKMSF